MEVLIFVLISSIEWMALIILAFAMFKMEIRWNLVQIIFSAILLSLVSHFLYKVFDLVGIASVLQPPVVFLFFWQMFRIPLFYAGLMTTNGYLGYATINAIVFNVFEMFDAKLALATWSMYTAQIASVCVALLISWLIHKFRIGFTFVPDGDRANVKLTGINLRLLLFTAVGYLVISGSNYLYFFGNYSLLFLIFTAVSLGFLQYWSFRRELSFDD